MASYAQPLNVANAASITTEAFNSQGLQTLGVAIPATFTSTTISFSVSHDGATYQDLYDSSNVLISQTVAAGRSYALRSEIKPWPFVKIKTGSAEGGARVLRLVAI